MNDAGMEEWHKALVLVMRKLGVVEILITQADVDAIQAIKDEDKRPCAVSFQDADGVHVRIITRGEVKELGGYQEQSH